MPIVITLKEKDYNQAQQVDVIKVYGEIEGKDVVLYDDLLDTGGTLVKTIEAVAAKKPRSINVLISH